MRKIDFLETRQLKSLLGFELDSLGHDETYNSIQKHRQDYWEIFVFNEGEGTHFIRFKEYHFQPKSIHFIQPHQTHLLKSNTSSNGFVLKFDNAYFLQSLMNKDLSINLNNLRIGKIPSIIHLQDNDFDSLWNILNVLKKDISNKNIYPKITFSNYLNIIFCNCIKYFNNTGYQTKQHNIDLYNKFLGLVLDEENNVEKLDDYLSLLSCSAKQLRSACMHCSGQNPLDIVHENLIHRAKKMLIFDQKSITDVAYELNFKDISHFTHFFKKKTGILPSKIL